MGQMKPVQWLAILLLLISCSQPVDLLNVAPSVTGIGPVINDNGSVSIVFWVRDHEENAVDVFFELVQDEKVTPIHVYGGHGDIGLTTSNDATGRAHVVLWKPDNVDPTANIQLRVQAQDDYGANGPVLETDPFTLADGLPPL
jgi:hypothetical protein